MQTEIWKWVIEIVPGIAKIKTQRDVKFLSAQEFPSDFVSLWGIVDPTDEHRVTRNIHIVATGEPFDFPDGYYDQGTQWEYIGTVILRRTWVAHIFDGGLQDEA